MITRSFITALISFLVVAVPSFGQRPDQATIDAIRQARLAQAKERQLEGAKRAYASLSARGLKTAGQAAWEAGSLYEQQEDWVNAATWYRTAYSKGNLGGSKGFVDLVLTDKIKIDNPDAIRPFVEVRAKCGSRIARAYVLEHWHEKPSQIPDYPPDEKLTECGPVGPEDHMDPYVLSDARRRQQEENQKQWAAEDSARSQKAAEGFALLLGALAIQAVSMPATGPGSIACNKYRNHYPGYTDASVCVESPQR